jgi:hypothetical protein
MRRRSTRCNITTIVLMGWSCCSRPALPVRSPCNVVRDVAPPNGTSHKIEQRQGRVIVVQIDQVPFVFPPPLRFSHLQKNSLGRKRGRPKALVRSSAPPVKLHNRMCGVPANLPARCASPIIQHYVVEAHPVFHARCSNDLALIWSQLLRHLVMPRPLPQHSHVACRRIEQLLLRAAKFMHEVVCAQHSKHKCVCKISLCLSSFQHNVIKPETRLFRCTPTKAFHTCTVKNHTCTSTSNLAAKCADGLVPRQRHNFALQDFFRFLTRQTSRCRSSFRRAEIHFFRPVLPLR